MPTLKEIKGRIGSVKSTLKITSAMKLVSSAKLHKAQQAAEAMRPYEEALLRILAAARGAACAQEASSAHQPAETLAPCAAEASDAHRPTAILAIASNSSLCGGFNTNIIAKVREVRQPGDVVYSIGRKMADAMRRDGFVTPEDLNSLIEHPAYSPAADLVSRLMEDCAKGRVDKVLLVYTHFVSTARQVPVAETLFALDPSAQVPQEDNPVILSDSEESDILIEPGRKELLEALEPKTIKLKLYSALLDSAAAEHAARTVAMQTATDNAENLLAELTLQYNKGRQQKITSEILDLAGGQMEE